MNYEIYRSLMRARNCVFILILIFAPQAGAITITTDNTITDVVPGLTGFATEGDQMDGMTVTAVFQGGQSETRVWADTAAGSGGVSGMILEWSLALTGDSFFNEWEFINNTQLGLVELILDGRTGFTLFDRTFGGEVGTNGSAAGRDFIEDPTMDGNAVYSRQVAIGNSMPVGDLWHVLTISFNQPPVTDFVFFQDTDNDARITAVPEPAALTLLGIVFARIGARNVKKKQTRSLI